MLSNALDKAIRNFNLVDTVNETDEDETLILNEFITLWLL